MDENALMIAALAFVAIGGYLALRGSATSDGSGQGNPSAFDPSVVALAQAIDVAEDSDPNNFNPGDLKVNANLSSLLTKGWTGKQALNGISIFDSLDDGWNALYNQIQFIINGESNLANLGSTISDLAYNYTTTNQDDWAETVASELASRGIVDASGNPVTPDTQLGDFLQ